MDVEAGVLHALRHHRARQLLEAKHELRVIVAVLMGQVFGPAEQKRVTDEIEDRRVHRSIPPDRSANREVDVLGVRRFDPTRDGIDVGAIDGKAGDRLAKGVDETAQREVTEAPVLLGDPIESVRQHRQFARHRHAQDQLLLLVDQLPVIQRGSDEVVVDPRHRPLVRRGDVQTIEKIHEAVADASRNRPVLAEPLVAGEYLLHDQVDRSLPRMERSLELQMAEVGARGEQAVDVVDAQTGDVPFADEAEDELMRGIEDLPVLDADTSEMVDVEETAVVDLLGRDTPVGEPVPLGVEDALHGIEAFGLARSSVVVTENPTERGAKSGRIRVQRQQPPPAHPALAADFLDALDIRRLARGQMFERGDDTLEFGEVIVSRPRFRRHRADHRPQDERRGARRNGQDVVFEGDPQSSLLEMQAKLAILQDLPELIAEDRQQYFPSNLRSGRVPVDIEIGSEGREATVLEDVHPPAVARLGDSHMVGDDVEKLPHPVISQRRREARELGFAPEVRAQAAVVGDIVAMRAPGACLKERGSVQIRDPQGVEVRNDRCRVLEAEMTVELNAIR